MIPNRCRFDYGDASSFTAELPVRPWLPKDSSVGGVRVAAGGLPASYIVRRDALIEVTLRIDENEWTEFLSLVLFGQTAQALIWFPDTEEATSFSVYLDTPKAGESWGPTRTNELPSLFEVTITLRGTGAVVPWRNYFTT